MHSDHPPPPLIDYFPPADSRGKGVHIFNVHNFLSFPFLFLIPLPLNLHLIFFPIYYCILTLTVVKSMVSASVTGLETRLDTVTARLPEFSRKMSKLIQRQSLSLFYFFYLKAENFATFLTKEQRSNSQANKLVSKKHLVQFFIHIISKHNYFKIYQY